MATLASRLDQASAPPALSVGDIAPACRLPDLTGTVVDLRGDAVAGNPTVILFCPRFTSSVAEALAGYRVCLRAMANAGAQVFGVIREKTGLAEADSISFPVLCDGAGQVFRAFGIDVGDDPTTVVLRPNYHIAAIIKSADKLQAAEALAAVERLAAERRPVLMGPHPPVLMVPHPPVLMVPHPPVLMVPEVLTPTECRRLIGIYETRGNVFMPPGPGI